MIASKLSSRCRAIVDSQLTRVGPIAPIAAPPSATGGPIRGGRGGGDFVGARVRRVGVRTSRAPRSPGLEGSRR